MARALTYVRSCTALAFRPDERAILTDHRILPLSWTRDAYYQALLLLAIGRPADRDIVADHLRWLWRRCERPGGSWMRSHHGNGAPKDLVYQADQQLYPLVELADFWRDRDAAGRRRLGADGVGPCGARSSRSSIRRRASSAPTRAPPTTRPRLRTSRPPRSCSGTRRCGSPNRVWRVRSASPSGGPPRDRRCRPRGPSIDTS